MSLRRQLKNSAVRKNVLTACGIIPHEEEVFRRTAEFFRLGRFCVFGLRNYSVRGISVFSPCGAVPQPEEASVRTAEFCMRPAICFFRRIPASLPRQQGLPLPDRQCTARRRLFAMLFRRISGTASALLSGRSAFPEGVSLPG